MTAVLTIAFLTAMNAATPSPMVEEEYRVSSNDACVMLIEPTKYRPEARGIERDGETPKAGKGWVDCRPAS